MFVRVMDIFSSDNGFCHSLLNKVFFYRLFDLSIPSTETYIVSYSFKSKGDNGVFLEMEGKRDNEDCRLIFTSDDNPSTGSDQLKLKDVIITPKPACAVLEPVYNQVCLPDRGSDWTTRYRNSCYSKLNKVVPF